MSAPSTVGRVKATIGNVNGTPVDHGWERWRGGIDVWRSGVDAKLLTISAQLEQVLESVRRSELARAEESGQGAQRKSFVAWIAPSLPSLLSGATAGLALAVALMR